MKRLPLILLSLTTLATMVFCLLRQGARRDHSDLVTLARSGAAETCTRFSDDQSHGDDGDDWGGVAAFHTFRQACALLPGQGGDDRAVCSAVYGQLLLNPDRAKAHLPERIAVMEPLAKTPRTHPPGCGCMSCGTFCRRASDFQPYHAAVHG